jgi:hypothetical protein
MDIPGGRGEKIVAQDGVLTQPLQGTLRVQGGTVRIPQPLHDVGDTAASPRDGKPDITSSGRPSSPLRSGGNSASGLVSPHFEHRFSAMRRECRTVYTGRLRDPGRGRPGVGCGPVWRTSCRPTTRPTAVGNWDQLAERLIWAHRHGFRSAKARRTAWEEDRPLLPSEAVALVEAATDLALAGD